MKHIAPTLTAIALMGAVPAFGASIADDLVIKPTVQLQVRAQLAAGGTDRTGNDYNPYTGVTGETEAARISIRRARFGASAKNSTGWDANFQIRAGERGDAGNAPTNNQAVQLYYANIGKAFKTDSIEHRLHIGIDKAFNGESTISSSTYMMPNDRAVANLIEYRGPEVGYTLKHEIVRFGVDLGNGGYWSNFQPRAFQTAADGTNGTVGVQNPAFLGASTSLDQKPGLFYSGRIEFAPGASFMPAKKMESFAGAEGTHLVIGFDFQVDNKNITSATAATTAAQTTTILGPDIVGHWNGLSGVADWRLIKVKQDLSGTNAANTASDDVSGSAFDFRVGYAIPMESGFAIEPAIGFGKVDLNKDSDEGGIAAAVFNSGEWQSGRVSGSQFEIGVNFYWNGHANKTQLFYTNWKGEDSAAAAPNDSAPKAHVITLQQQVTF